MRRELRLRKRSDFLHARARGRRVNDRLLTFQVARVRRPDTRFGLAVGKRVGGAVVRNRVKRRLRECLSTLDVAPGFNIVVSARPAAAAAGYHVLLDSVRALAGRAKVLGDGDAGPAERPRTDERSNREVEG